VVNEDIVPPRATGTITTLNLSLVGAVPSCSFSIAEEGTGKLFALYLQPPPVEGTNHRFGAMVHIVLAAFQNGSRSWRRSPRTIPSMALNSSNS
jgi:hypothetical protein